MAHDRRLVVLIAIHGPQEHGDDLLGDGEAGQCGEEGECELHAGWTFAL